jgi:hypothetical protein
VNRDQRRQQMLASLPLLLQEGANIGELFAALARILSGEAVDGGMEHGLTRLLRSRWHGLARGWEPGDQTTPAASELGRFAALYGFPPGPHESTPAFRRRLLEFIAIHRDGLTTAPAILRLVALVYQAEASPKIGWDAQGRRAHAEFVADAGGERTRIRVELQDNPRSPSLSRFTAVLPGRRLIVNNTGLDPAIPEIRLRPLGAPAQAPVLIHANSGLRLIFAGPVPPGATLTLRHRQPPLIDGVPRPEFPVLLTNPFVFDGAASRFGGTFGGADLPGARYSVAQRDSSLPTLEPGESAWTYDVMSRSELAAFLGPWPELAAHAQFADPVPKAPNADLELRWDESVPASLALRVPADRVPAAFAGDLGAFVRGLEWALAYGRAAGVRSRVELALPHVHERLQLRDELTLQASAGFTDAAPISESAPPPTPGIGLTDTLEPPTDDALSFGGLFNTTPFDTSLFF